MGDTEKLKSCEAVLWHGNGHQSRTKCQLKGKHTLHHTVYGCYDQEASWKGKEACTGFFDESPIDIEGE